jgi:ATP-binding cassette subfamily B protein
MTVTAIGLSIVFGLPFLFMHKLSRKLAVKNVETANKMTGVLNETIQAAKIILGFGRQNESRQSYLDAFNGHSYYSLRILVISTAVPQLFAPLGMLAGVFAMGVALNQGTAISELAAVMWSLLAAMPILSALIQGNISIRYFLPSYEQLIALRERAKEYEEIEGSKQFESLKTGIFIKNCTFTYPGRKSTILDCNINIIKGKMTALIGDSGSGKSTITDLILGLQIPDRGEILIDGTSINDYKQNSFRERVGYVPQDPILFHTTIKENLLWAFPDATDDELWHSLELANSADFVKALPLGIKTFVGDRGVRLSGGQRQRIALARALVRNPDLLILDEATSALDSESERLIQKSIEKVSQDSTVLVIAHRLSTISKADYVYILDHGSVIEEGSYEKLSKSKGSKFNKMISAGHPI